MSAFSSLLAGLVAVEASMFGESMTYSSQDPITSFPINGVFDSGELFELTNDKYHAAVKNVKEADFLVSPTRGDTLTRAGISYVVAHVSNGDDANTRVIFLRKP